jgi:hypothetical protein
MLEQMVEVAFAKWKGKNVVKLIDVEDDEIVRE